MPGDRYLEVGWRYLIRDSRIPNIGIRMPPFGSGRGFTGEGYSDSPRQQGVGVWPPACTLVGRQGVGQGTWVVGAPRPKRPALTPAPWFTQRSKACRLKGRGQRSTQA